jgi:hypothetical protein
MCVLENIPWQLSHCPIKYISNLVLHRGGTDTHVDDLDDSRNGLLLSMVIHRPLGAGEVAFLKV